jgi:hypothetical protein
MKHTKSIILLVIVVLICNALFAQKGLLNLIEEKLSGLDYVNTFHSSFAISSETKTGFDI